MTLSVDTRGWIQVQKVRNGRGLVALRSFRAGALVMPVLGKLVTAKEVWRYWDKSPKAAANCFRYDGDRYLDPAGELGAFANHSCQPNTGVVRRGRMLMLKAIAPIQAGDEITHDYSTLLGADDVWTMRCNCGEDSCRRAVRNVSKLPRSTLQRYRRLGVVPGFISATVSRET